MAILALVRSFARSVAERAGSGVLSEAVKVWPGRAKRWQVQEVQRVLADLALFNLCVQSIQPRQV